MPRRNELGSIRRSQVVATYGPGAIIDFRSQRGAPISVIAAGLDEWDAWAPPAGLAHPQTTFEPRLQQRLDVKGFRLPPVQPQMPWGTKSGGPAIPAVRFPRWLQCPQCHLMKTANKWKSAAGDPARYCACPTESGRDVGVVPVRFIVACENGHVDEFPWEQWLTHTEENCQGALELTGGGRAGLAGVMLRCRDCRATRSLAGIFGKDALKPRVCKGRMPWLGLNDTCSLTPRVVQRGASNLYFPVTISALDIPPWSDRIQKRLGVYWEALREAPPEERPIVAKALKLHNKLGLSLEALLFQVEERIRALNARDVASLRIEEYRSFVDERSSPMDGDSEFSIRTERVPPELGSWIARVVRVTRLREVRAILGFTRIHEPPPIGETSAIQTRMGRIQAARHDWLPAIEVRGEGVFLELRRERIEEWERTNEQVRRRAATVHAAFEKAWWSRQGPEQPLPFRVTPRRLLVHSLSHALMRQLSLECGYSSSSLRERLYIDDDPERSMAGLLLYTSTPDADGTLGGLARQGQPARIAGAIEGALRAMAWCSSDPLCAEGHHSQSEPQNLAACHACLLVSETSCEEFNLRLDRATLTGSTSDRSLGFFAGFLEG